MRQLLHRFIDDQSGVTAIEYGLIVCLFVIGIISAVTVIGMALSANGPVAAGLT